MEKYNKYKAFKSELNEARSWLNNKNKIDSQSSTKYSLHNLTFSADYCGQAYAGANNYHNSPKTFNKYLCKVISAHFSDLTDKAISLMEEESAKLLIDSEEEISNIQKEISDSKKVLT